MTETSEAAVQSPAPAKKRLPPSPCVGVCTMDVTTPYCFGCGRTADDITNWPMLAAREQREIWQVLPGRLAEMGVSCFRLAPEPEEIAGFIARSLREHAGDWAIGSVASHVSFRPAGRFDVSIRDDVIEAQDDDGHALRIIKHDRVRAFGLTLSGGDGTMRAVALVLPKGRAEMAQVEAVSELGQDQDAISAMGRQQLLFDLGEGDNRMRRLLRASDVNQAAQLRAVLGQVPDDETVRAAGQAASAGASRICATAMGRVEAPGDDAPAELTLAEVDIPSAFAVCAVFKAHEPGWLAAALAT